MNHDVEKELNTFLKGNFMAIHAYDRYIHHTPDTKTKQVLQQIQQNHKQHATWIAERIQNIGGMPVDDVGLMGNMVEWFKAPTKDPAHILQDALAGEHRGIEKSRELLEGDLDPESLALVERILDADRQHIEWLDELQH